MYYSGMTHTSMAYEQWIAELAAAINGEYSAIACYERIAGLVPTEEARNRILEIRQDEIRHFHEFAQIYTSLTGRQPVPQITEACPNDYAAGLRFAFQDEQETVDRYLDMADRAPDARIRDQFKRAAADEQHHAVWFLYFMTVGK